MRTIESYVETNAAGAHCVSARRVARPNGLAALGALVDAAADRTPPEGPSKDELEAEGHLIVLEIEDAFRKRILDWRWQTPNVYQLTAQLVVAVAETLAARGGAGWLTPAELLPPLELAGEPTQGAFARLQLAGSTG